MPSFRTSVLRPTILSMLFPVIGAVLMILPGRRLFEGKSGSDILSMAQMSIVYVTDSWKNEFDHAKSEVDKAEQRRSEEAQKRAEAARSQNVAASFNEGIARPVNPVPTAYNPNGAPVYTANAIVKTDRSIWMFLLLSLVTCSIYQYFFIYELVKDVNIICEGDGDTTPGLLPFILLSIVTCGIYSYIWLYKLGNRLAINGQRYGINIIENGTSVILWMLLGSLLCGAGYFVGWDIIIKNTNLLGSAYNQRCSNAY